MALLPVAPLQWEQEIADAAEEEMNCTITVSLPGTAGTYNPATDTSTGGTADTALLTNRAARAQHYRLPLETAGSAEWSSKRHYRFQLVLKAGDPFIPKGAIVQVTRSDLDPSLLRLSFTVVSGAGSSHTAVRTLECVTEYGQAH